MTSPSPFDAPEQLEEPQQTRWRIIPAALLSIFGLVLIIGGLLTTILIFFVQLPPARPRSALLLNAVLWTGIGAIIAAAGRMVWRRQWLAAVLTTLIAWALGAVTAMTFQH